MKNILLIFAIAFSTASFSQGNLQFNQVINGSLNGLVFSTGTGMGTIVVPAGKVWKIESVAYTYMSPSIPYPHSSNGASVFIENHTVYQNIGNQSTTLPLWLSEGTYNVNARVASNIVSTFSYSVIEFNVVP